VDLNEVQLRKIYATTQWEGGREGFKDFALAQPPFPPHLSNAHQSHLLKANYKTKVDKWPGETKQQPP